MSTPDIVAERERELEAKGYEKGYKEGYEEGYEGGFLQGLIESLLILCRGRFGEMPEDLQRLIEATRDRETLRSWRRLLYTSTAESFAQAVRAAPR
jgi:hypothetical protein